MAKTKITLPQENNQTIYVSTHKVGLIQKYGKPINIGSLSSKCRCNVFQGNSGPILINVGDFISNNMNRSSFQEIKRISPILGSSSTLFRIECTNKDTYDLSKENITNQRYRFLCGKCLLEKN